MPANTFKLLGLLLLIVAVNSQALTLGRLRGAALVGQSLDVSVQVQLDGDESPAGLCFEADVFHADTRQDPARVQVSVESTPQSQSVNVRVQATGQIDEPVVTVYLRAGCAQKISRRYVLLADVVSEPAAPPAPRFGQVPLVLPMPSAAPPAGAEAAPATGAMAGAPAQSTEARARPAGNAPARRARPPQRQRSASAAAMRKPAAPKAAPAAPAAPAPAQPIAKAPVEKAQARLKLEAPDVLTERVAMLESSAASATAESSAREARDAQRIESLEASVKNLLAVATRNEANLASVRADLQRAESERYQNPLVYVLASLLVLCLVLLLFVLTRRNQHSGAGHGNWWSGTAGGAPTIGTPETGPGAPSPSGFSPMSAPGALDAQAEQTQQVQRAGPQSRPGPITQVDVSLVEMSESTFDRLMQSGVTHSAVRKQVHTDAQPTVPPSTRRPINSEELFDIRQQAEFFVSLGQTDQAVRILEARISESGESSPLAYLDLMRIFHSLGLRADFRQVREDFSLLFNARVPEFPEFLDEGRGLDDYPDVVSGIAAVWGTSNIFAAIEAIVFRDQWNTQRETLDLAAFRDLLLLHAIAQSVATPSDGTSVPAALTAAYNPAATYPLGPSSAAPGRNSVQPSSVQPADVPLPTLDGVPDLDIDLSDLHIPKGSAMPPQTAPAQEAAKPSEAGNLIDFDLPDLPPKTGPRG